MRLQSASCAGSIPAPVSPVKRLAWLPWALFVLAVIVNGAFFRESQDARAESARLRRSLDSLAVVQGRVDTVTVERWRTLTRIETHRDTLRDSLTITDTVEVRTFIAVQDSVITACHAVISSCEEGKRVRDHRIAALDSLNRDTERRLTASQRKATRDKLVALGIGALAGFVWPR